MAGHVAATRTTPAAAIRRVVSIWFPFWHIDLLLRRMHRRGKAEGSRVEPADRRRDAHAPVLMTQSQQGREVVAAACPHAMAAGVRIGMSLTHARALIRQQAIVVPWTPENDARALHALASWCNRFSPTVGIDPPDGLVMDVTGTDRLHRGEHRLLTLIRHSMERLGLRSRIAIASSVGCARAASRHDGHACIRIQPGNETDYLSRLPLEALNIADGAVGALREMGFDRIGDIMRLPRASVPARFGTEVLECLDAALGKRAETITPVRPKEALHVEHVFDGPTTHWESIERCAGMLVRMLMDTLMAGGIGVRRLEVRLLVTNRHPPAHIVLTLCRPSRDEHHVWSMLRPRLERAELGAGVEGITLVASRTGPLPQSQGRLRGTSDDPSRDVAEHRDPDIARAVLSDTLMSRLGTDAVLRMFHVESHVPERTLRLMSVMSNKQPGDASSWNPTPRPSRLFLQPEPIQVLHLSPDGPIHQLRWRNMSWDVSACIGPERICSPWWSTAPQATEGGRDYYRICIETGGLESRWIWIYRLIDHGTWHAHGEWA